MQGRATTKFWGLGRLLALGLLLLGLAGCRGGAAGPQIGLQLTPAAPVAGQATRFTLQLTGADAGKAGATATLTLEMATMDMGTTPVALTESSAGTWTGTGQFTMAGDWNCQAEVTLGGKTTRQTFHVKVS